MFCEYQKETCYCMNRKNKRTLVVRRSMKIRKAIKEDIDYNLLNLFIEGYQLHYENRKDKFRKMDSQELKETLIEKVENTNVIVIEENTHIVGYLSYQINEKMHKTVWIDELVIDKSKRGQGFSKLLLEEVEKIAKEEGCSAIEFCCWSFNENAKKVYKHLNYQEQRIIYEKHI